MVKNLIHFKKKSPQKFAQKSPQKFTRKIEFILKMICLKIHTKMVKNLIHFKK